MLFRSPELAVLFLEVVLPDFFAVHRKRSHCARTRYDPNVLPVGNRRGRRRVLLIPDSVPRVKLALPKAVAEGNAFLGKANTVSQTLAKYGVTIKVPAAVK